MSKTQISVVEAQKKAESIRQPEQEPAGLQVPVQQVAPQTVYRRAQLNRNGLTPADILALQRIMGNRQVQRMAMWRTGHANGQRQNMLSEEKPGVKVQTRLILGVPNDIYEQEANHMAAQVMPIPEPEPQEEQGALPTKTLSTQTLIPVQRQDQKEESEEGAIMPAVASVEAIQSKIADLVKLKPKQNAYGEENAADRATIITSIKEIRTAIAALKASDLGMTADQLKTLKAQFYLQINKVTPSYYQMENLDILWSMDKGKRNTAPGRTCNVTALSISLESLGVTPKEFKGDKELLKLIWKYQQDQMSENSKKDEETAISKLKGKTKEKQEAALRAKGEKERTRLAALDPDGLRMPDFMQLVVIYNVLLKTGKVTSKMNGLGLDASAIKAMAAGQPDKFKETMDRAHGLARNSILFSNQFRDFAGWFGITANSRSIKYSAQLDKLGEFGRARWKVQELQGQLSEIERKAEAAGGKAKAQLEKEANRLRSNIVRRKRKIVYTITEQEQELASLRAKAGRATGEKQATLTAQADELAATIEARKGKQQEKITKMEADLEKLKERQAEGVKGKAAAALEKKIKAKQGQIDELKSPTSIQSMEQFETMIPLKDYKDEVTGVFVPILSAGKHVEVNLHNHFVHLVEINENGPVVDEVGEGAGKRLQLSWEKARALGYFQSSTVYEI